MARKARRSAEHHLYRRPDKPGGTYYVDCWKTDPRDGKKTRYRESLDTTSLKEAKQRRDALLEGEVALKWGKRTTDVSLDEFWKLAKDLSEDTGAYITWARSHKRPASIARERVDWQHLQHCLHPKTLGSVSPADVERFKRYLEKERGQKNVTINNACVRLRALYNHAIKRGAYKGQNPFAKFDRLPVDEKRIQFLTGDEIIAVIEAAEAHSRDIHLFCSLAVFAGLRTGEAVNALWSWVDFTRGAITVQSEPRVGFSTKSRRTRAIPLHSRLRDILEQYRQPEGYIILPGKLEPGKWRIRYEPKKAFAAVVKTACVPWCTPHTLRHTFASQLVSAGVSLYKVQIWLGHRSPTTTQIYAHLTPTDEDINRF